MPLCQGCLRSPHRIVIVVAGMGHECGAPGEAGDTGRPQKALFVVLSTPRGVQGHSSLARVRCGAAPTCPPPVQRGQANVPQLGVRVAVQEHVGWWEGNRGGCWDTDVKK